MTVLRPLLHTVKSAPGPISKDFQSSKPCCLLVLKTNAPTRASRPRMIENLDADAVLTPTASGYLFDLLGGNVQDISHQIVLHGAKRYDGLLKARGPRAETSRLKGAKPGRRRPVGAKPDPALQTIAQSYFRAFHTVLLTDSTFGSPHTNAIHSSPSTMPWQLASQSSTGLLPAS